MPNLSFIETVLAYDTRFKNIEHKGEKSITFNALS